MRNFTSVKDVQDVERLIKSALDLKRDPFRNTDTGKHKVLGLIFMNPSLRTRLSTQRAALNLGMETMVMNFSGEGWALETGDGVVMDGDKAEHIREAAAVIGEYCDIIGIRSFPGLVNRDEDYSEDLLVNLVHYAGKPVISLESATRHPLQSLADLVTIEEKRTTRKPRVVMTWAPHPKVLPQSVPNSFLEWASKMDYDLQAVCPPGYELDRAFSGDIPWHHDQDAALEGADFVYVKNWSSYSQYGSILSNDPSWMITLEKLKNTNRARVMHCLPVRRNVVIADEVLESDRSIVIEEAGNRVWAAQAVLMEMINSTGT